MTALEPMSVAPAVRLKLAVRGAVQGVGFRPFVYRLANELGLTGGVNNSPQGVFIEVEGGRVKLEQFRHRLEAEKPPRSSIQSCEASWLDAVGHAGFVIRASEATGAKTTLVLPDIATCPDCLREVFDPANRRHRYPFTNCTNCGPRFSIIEALPYDRANTSMKQFELCPACAAEYEDPSNRRFHAQPNACPICGPHLELWHPDGKVLSSHHDALFAAAEALRRGEIVAVKGLGGFHLLVDARNDAAVCRLRERKHREEKPLALMFRSLESVLGICEVSPLEEHLLCSPEAPIVLLSRVNAQPHPSPLPQERENGSAVAGDCESVPRAARSGAKSNQAEMDLLGTKFQRTTESCSLSSGQRIRVRASVEQTQFGIAESVAPGNPNLGVMLPSNPLHHLLMTELGFPVVATSGNLSDEPICVDEFEALDRLRGIADVFLVHNRPIVRHIDDSIVRVMLDREMILRRARGYAPLPIAVVQVSKPAVSPRSKSAGRAIASAGSETGFTADSELCATILAVGAHLKNSVALAVGEHVFISQHIGDLETEPANAAFRHAAADLPRLYDARPEIIAADRHPDYLSTKFALERRASSRLDSVGVQASACSPRPLKHEIQRAGSEVGAPQIVRVQHHVAHVLSCIAENQVELPALGVAWDGSGYGTDGTIWGGEFFLVTDDNVERVASLRPFRLPGGDAAVKEPRRAALGLLHELPDRRDNLSSYMRQKVADLFSPAEWATVEMALTRNLNSPWCSSVGRLFDAVAALVGWRQRTQFEGQAAMELEFALEGIRTAAAYELPIANQQSPMTLDWSLMIPALGEDLQRGVSIGEISAKFHNGLAEAIVQVARRVNHPRVALSGGCFQNRYLTERAVTRLRAEGFQPYWHQRVPPNDGGIALGQIVAVRRELAKRGATFPPHEQSKDELLAGPNGSVPVALKRVDTRAPIGAKHGPTITHILHPASR